MRSVASTTVTSRAQLAEGGARAPGRCSRRRPPPGAGAARSGPAPRWRRSPRRRRAGTAARPAREPVARITCSAVMRGRAVGRRRPCRSCASGKVAQPATTRTLARLSRPATPPFSLSTMPSFQRDGLAPGRGGRRRQARCPCCAAPRAGQVGEVRGGVDQGLGGDAAADEAGAAQAVGLDQHGVQAQLAGSGWPRHSRRARRRRRGPWCRCARLMRRSMNSVAGCSSRPLIAWMKAAAS